MTHWSLPLTGLLCQLLRPTQHSCLYRSGGAYCVFLFLSARIRPNLPLLIILFLVSPGAQPAEPPPLSQAISMASHFSRESSPKLMRIWAPMQSVVLRPALAACAALYHSKVPLLVLGLFYFNIPIAIRVGAVPCHGSLLFIGSAMPPYNQARCQGGVDYWGHKSATLACIWSQLANSCSHKSEETGSPLAWLRVPLFGISPASVRCPWCATGRSGSRAPPSNRSVLKHAVVVARIFKNQHPERDWQPVSL